MAQYNLYVVFVGRLSSYLDIIFFTVNNDGTTAKPSFINLIHPVELVFKTMQIKGEKKIILNFRTGFK